MATATTSTGAGPAGLDIGLNEAGRAALLALASRLEATREEVDLAARRLTVQTAATGWRSAAARAALDSLERAVLVLHAGARQYADAAGFVRTAAAQLPTRTPYDGRPGSADRP